MDIRRNDKNKPRVMGCKGSGRETLVIQREIRITVKAFDEYQSGDERQLQLGQLEKKGDGFRVQNEGQIKRRISVMRTPYRCYA